MRHTGFAAFASATATAVLVVAASVSFVPTGSSAPRAVDPLSTMVHPDVPAGTAMDRGGPADAVRIETLAAADHLGPTTRPAAAHPMKRAKKRRKPHRTTTTATSPAAVRLTTVTTVATPTTVTTVAKPAAGTPLPAGSSKGFGLAAAPGDLIGTPDQIDAIMADYQSVGLTWLRTPISWLTVQSARNGPYDWSHYDIVMAAAARHNLHVIAIIGGTPAWARAANCTGRNGWEEACPPLADVAGYSAINAAMAARYPGLVLEVWYEPNLESFWSPAPDPAGYTRVLIAAYNAIKSASPQTTVLSAGLTLGWNNPGLSMNPVDFLSAVYANGGGGHFDGVAWHPYLWHAWGAAASMPGTPSVDSSWYQMYGTNPSARSVMTANGDSAKKIWVTEMGANTQVPNQIYMTEAEQAAMVTKAVQLWSSYPWAGAFNFYTYQDGFPNGASQNSEGYFGMWRANHSPKPAVAALRSAVAAAG